MRRAPFKLIEGIIFFGTAVSIYIEVHRICKVLFCQDILITKNTNLPEIEGDAPSKKARIASRPLS